MDVRENLTDWGRIAKVKGTGGCDDLLHADIHPAWGGVL